MTEGLSNESELSRQEQFEILRGLAETMPESVMITTTEDFSETTDILYVNKNFTKLTGYNPSDVIGKTPKILQGEKTDPEVLEQLKVDLRERRHFHGRAVNYRKNGEPFTMDWDIVPFHLIDGTRSYYLTVQREIKASTGSVL